MGAQGPFQRSEAPVSNLRRTLSAVGGYGPSLSDPIDELAEHSEKTQQVSVIVESVERREARCPERPGDVDAPTL